MPDSRQVCLRKAEAHLFGDQSSVLVGHDPRENASVGVRSVSSQPLASLRRPAKCIADVSDTPRKPS